MTEEDRLTTDGLEDVLTSEVETVEDETELVARDQVDQAAAETMDWLRKRLDESQTEIARLNNQLQGASHRNGYLEAQMETYQDQIKLLTQRPENDADASLPQRASEAKSACARQVSLDENRKLAHGQRFLGSSWTVSYCLCERPRVKTRS